MTEIRRRSYNAIIAALSIGGHPDQLAAVAAELNTRPRKTLGWDTPAERLARLTGTAAQA